MPDLVLPLSLASSAVALAAGGAYFGLERFRQTLNPDPVDTYLSDSLDFKLVHEDGLTLIGREGSLTRTFLIEGQDYGLCNEGELIRLLNQRGLFFDDIVAKEELTLRIITRRVPVEITCEGTYDNPYLQILHNKWQGQFKRTYKNLHYLVLTRKPTHSKVNFLKREQSSPVEKGKFDETCDRIENALSNFKLKSLSGHTGGLSRLLSFWGSLVNGQETTISSFTRNIAERLVGTSIEFDWTKGRIHFDDGVSQRVGAIVSINEWGDESSSKLFRDLARLEGDITYLHLIKGIPRLKALSILKTKESEEGGLFNSITDRAAEQYDAAKQVIQDEEGSLHGYQFSMIIIADTEKELLSLIKKANLIFSDYGTKSVVEKQAVEHIWRCQFPGHETFVRKSDIFSHNLSSILTFDKDPVGLSKCDWGEGSLRNFKTINGSSFPLNLHESEEDKALGHNLVIAPSSSGKTVLMQHIIAGALRHPELRVFIFDRYNGTRIFTESCGGEYIDIESEKGVTLNPFLDKDSVSSRARLRILLKMMSGDDEVSASELNDVVDLILGLDPDLRIFSKIYKSLLRSNSDFSTNLKEWATGSHAHWFNGEKNGKAYDALDLRSKRLVSFEMTQILGDDSDQGAKASVVPLTYYIMERILSVVRDKACPSWVFIDEAKPMLDTLYFRKYVAVFLREMRKIGGVVTLCFQGAGDLQETGISKVILGQCKTLFLFPDPSANREDYEKFKLTDSEWEYVQGNNPTAKKYKRTVLMKKKNESVILNIDLSVLGKYFKLYKSDNNLVKYVNELKKQEGDQWVDTYLEA